MENVQAKLDNFMRGVRGEKMDYVPIMMDFEPTYICEYTNRTAFVPSGITTALSQAMTRS